jgi:type II secretion system protein G
MKVRCPYCQGLFDSPSKSAVCPDCGKASLVKSFFGRSDRLSREGRRRERDISPTQPWLMSGRIMGLFLLWAGLPRWIIWLCGLALIGAFLFHPKGDLDFPELRKSAKESLSVLHVALDIFKDDCGRYPLASEGLAALVSNPSSLEGWKGPYVRKLLRDPWGHPYIYSPDASGSSFELRSAGPDGLSGSKDDILPDLRPFDEERRTPDVLILRK